MLEGSQTFPQVAAASEGCHPKDVKDAIVSIIVISVMKELFQEGRCSSDCPNGVVERPSYHQGAAYDWEGVLR